MRRIATIAVAAMFVAAGAQAQTVLRASHQFPGGKGDPRDEMVQIIAREVKAANVGLDGIEFGNAAQPFGGDL